MSQTFVRSTTATGYRSFLCDFSNYEEILAGETIVSAATPVSVPAGLIFGTAVVASPKVQTPVSTFGVTPGLYRVKLLVTLASGKTLPMETCSILVTP